MTARLSTGKSGLRTYFLHKLSQLKGSLAMICIMSMISYPLIAVCANVYMNIQLEKNNGPVGDEQFYEFNTRISMYGAINNTLLVIGFLAVVFLFLEGFFVVRKNFRYLYDKQYTDMDMSLPIDHNTRFFGDILSGLTVYMIPQIIALILGALILIPTYQYKSYDFYLGFESATMLLTRGGIIFVSASLMQFFFMLMIMSFCGRKLTANIVPFIFTAAVPLTVIFMMLIIGSCCYGLSFNNIYGMFGDSLVFMCSPLGMCLTVFLTQTQKWDTLVCGPVEAISVLLSAAYGCAAYFMIKYRRAERTGNAFVYKGGRYATQFMIIFASATLIFMPVFANMNLMGGGFYALSSFMYTLMNIPADVLIISWVIINLVLFAVIELVCREKLLKPKKLLMSVLRFGGGVLASFLICVFLSKCEGFGAADYIPAAGDIDYIRLYNHSPGRMLMMYDSVNIDDEQYISEIEDFHRRILSERPDYRKTSSEEDKMAGAYVNFQLEYYLKNGTVIEREYYLPKEYTRDAMELAFDCGVFAEQYKLSDSPDDENAMIKYDKHYEGRPEINEVVTVIPYREFAEAVRLDAEQTDLEDMFFGEGIVCKSVWAYDGKNTSKSICVYSTFENTKALFRKYNYDLFADMYENVVKYYLVKYESVGSCTAAIKVDYDPMTGYSEREYREITPEQASVLIPYSSVSTAYNESRDIYMLMTVCEYYDDGGNVYYSTGDNSLLVTEKHCDTAAEIYNSAVAATDEEMSIYLPGYR